MFPLVFEYFYCIVLNRPTSVIKEELEGALNAVEEAIYDHVVDVLHIGLPLLGGRLSSEQPLVALRHNKESPSPPHSAN